MRPAANLDAVWYNRANDSFGQGYEDIRQNGDAGA